jgi:hypothetical protein
MGGSSNRCMLQVWPRDVVVCAPPRAPGDNFRFSLEPSRQAMEIGANRCLLACRGESASPESLDCCDRRWVEHLPIAVLSKESLSVGAPPVSSWCRPMETVRQRTGRWVRARNSARCCVAAPRLRVPDCHAAHHPFCARQVSFGGQRGRDCEGRVSAASDAGRVLTASESQPDPIPLLPRPRARVPRRLPLQRQASKRAAARRLFLDRPHPRVGTLSTTPLHPQERACSSPLFAPCSC